MPIHMKSSVAQSCQSGAKVMTGYMEKEKRLMAKKGFREAQYWQASFGQKRTRVDTSNILNL